MHSEMHHGFLGPSNLHNSQLHNRGLLLLLLLHPCCRFVMRASWTWKETTSLHQHPLLLCSLHLSLQRQLWPLLLLPLLQLLHLL